MLRESSIRFGNFCSLGLSYGLILYNHEAMLTLDLVIDTYATPTIVSGDRENVDVIAHELSHSYSGNLVSNASWEHFWV